MPPSFDLAERGFCRVRWRPGRAPADPDALVGFRELLVRAPDIEDVEVPHPPALAGLLRVLYVLTARVTELDKVSEANDWDEAREAALERGGFDTDAISEYFAEYAGRFELFHTAAGERSPFCQDPRLLEQCRTSKGEPTSSGVNKLMLGRAAGQGFVWQSHTVDADPRPVPVPDAVFAMLAWLYFGVPGRCTPRRVGAQSAADTGAGPLRGTVSFHPFGESLFETLLLGVPYAPGSGPAVWEDELRDPLGVPPGGEGIGALLAGRFRHALLLEPTESGQAVADARITWAWRVPHGPDQDPYLIYRPGKEPGAPPYPQAAQSDRAVWRDLDCLLGEHDEAKQPAVFEGLGDLMDAQERTLRVKALGFDQDRSQAKDRQYFAGATSAKSELWQQVSPQHWGRMRRAREAAEDRGRHLRGALSYAWRELAGASKPSRARDGGVRWLHTGMARYWDAAEKVFWKAVEPEVPPPWSVVNRYIEVAVQAYDEVTRSAARTPRDVEVLERHRRRLWTGFEADAGDEERGADHG
ncbi:type I-E CRISPR-associated protein Cse1/CasA [Saccharopolyspora cebuensis]|uniref:type I-E CRISPR-associated protein Cse1/CasA n=1 Tax=Saccharopolyspora cebuensis TaxID=418759 RepID=UPI0031F00975